MAATATPYGLRAVNHLGGTPYAGSTRMYPIASATAINIYYGSVVNVLGTGFLTANLTVGTAAAPFVAGTVGIFVGCTYTDPGSNQVVFRQNWPTGTVTADAVAYVIDDPAVIFQVQANGAVTAAALGSCCSIIAQLTGTGNLTSGNNFEDYNLPDDVSFVLGRSYYEDSDDAEVFFVATDSEQVKRIANHYGLQVPYNDRLKDKLDNDPASLRVRHYDMLGLGEGNFVPVVACGLVFVDGTVTQLKLYEFDRGEG